MGCPLGMVELSEKAFKGQAKKVILLLVKCPFEKVTRDGKNVGLKQRREKIRFELKFGSFFFKLFKINGGFVFGGFDLQRFLISTGQCDR